MEISASLKNRLIKIIKKFERKKVLVIGDVILDRYIWGDVDRISPEAPVPVIKVESETYRIGGAGNVATNIKSLGGDVIFLSIIGNDNAGMKLKELFSKNQIDTSGLLIEVSKKTVEKIRIIARNQQVCRVDREKDFIITGELIEKCIAFIKRHLNEVEYIVLSDYGKGLLDKNLLGKLIPYLKKVGKEVVVDPNPYNFESYKSINTITPNRREVEEITHIKIRSDSDLKRCAERIFEKIEVENVLITLGSKGMKLFRPSGFNIMIPTVAREVFDVTGAGDTVVAAYTLSMASGGTPEEAAIISNFAAGIVVGKVGTGTVSSSEIINEIRSR